MKRFTLISFIIIIGLIILSSIYFIGNDEVKDYTKEFIYETITLQHYEALTEEDNQKIKVFFQSFEDLQLPYPIIENVIIPYYGVFSDPTFNGNFSQYISVQYEPIDGTSLDTNIYFEYISYAKDSNLKEIYFGQIDVHSKDSEFRDIEIISISPMEKQK